jgi:hypothetical protein
MNRVIIIAALAFGMNVSAQTNTQFITSSILWPGQSYQTNNTIVNGRLTSDFVRTNGLHMDTANGSTVQLGGGTSFFGTNVTIGGNNGASLRVEGNATVLGDLNMDNGKITNVSNGTLSTTSKEAVNGSQLNATNGRLTTAESNIGILQSTKADKVQVAKDIQQARGEAIRISNEYTDEKIMEVNYKVDKEVTRLDNRIDATNKVVEANKKEAADATAKVQSNLDKEAKRLDMKIDTEIQKVESKFNQRITELDTRLNNRIDNVLTYVGNEFKAINNRIDGLGAMTVALSTAATSSVYNPDKPTNVNFATGYYGRSGALALGVSHFLSSNTKLSVNYAAGSFTKSAVGVGVGFAF